MRLIHWTAPGHRSAYASAVTVHRHDAVSRHSGPPRDRLLAAARQERGRVPVDASKASKDPSRRQYFFGAHDANRIQFTRGRDITLEPKQKGEPLNYSIYPYAELDGKPWSGLQVVFSFRNVQNG